MSRSTFHSSLPALWRSALRITGWRLIGASLLTVTTGFTSGLVVLALIPIMQAAGGLGPDVAPTSRLFTAMTALTGGARSLPAAIGLLVAMTGLQGGLVWWQSRLGAGVVQDFVLARRRRLFGAVCHAPWAVYTRLRSSDLLETLTRGVDRSGNAVYEVLTLSATATTAVVYTGLAVWVSGPITLVVLGLGAVMAMALARRRQRAVALGEGLSAANRSLYRSAAESIAAMKLVRSHGVEVRQVADFTRSAGAIRHVYVQIAARPVALKLYSDLGAMLMLGLVSYIGFVHVGLQPAELLVLVVIFMKLAPQFTALQISAQSLSIQLPAFAALEACEHVLGAATEPPRRSGPVAFTRDIQLDAVSAGYGAEHVVLRDVTLRMRAGEFLAIVGPSGAGKTTLADVLMGLLPPSAGAMRVDGVPLDPACQAWRDQIGYVPQDTFLFHDSIAANLRWAVPAATDDELWEVLRAASADEVVATLPEGLDTIVGDRGVRLSGGERQRIALARALLRRPALLVLDEATSALDSQHERRIQDAIGLLRGTMAIVWIAHRLSTVREADTIAVVDAGRVVEHGSWDELLRRPAGRLRSLYEAQRIAFTDAAPVPRWPAEMLAAAGSVPDPG